MSHQLTDSSAPIRVTSAPASPETRRAWLRAALVLGLFAVTGAGLGVVWEHVWQPSQGLVVRREWFVVDSEFRYDPAGLRNQFSGTGLFVVIGGAAGLVLGGLMALLARRDELLVLGTVAVGSVVAAVLMWQVGTRLGPADPQVLALTAERGTVLPDHLALGSPGALLVWPLASLVALCAVFLLIPGRHRE